METTLTSDKQLLRSLLARLEGNPKAEGIRIAANRHLAKGTLTKAILDAMNDQLLGLLPETLPELPVAPAVRTNRYEAPCERCGEPVGAEKGTLEREGTRWVVSHKEGECPEDAFEGVPQGRYAVEVDGVLKFYQVKQKTLFAQASDELYPVKDPDDILVLIREDIPTAAARYGQELGVCGRCGRTLTDETSRLIGLGPICRERAW